MTAHRKYTQEMLEEAAQNNISVTGVMRSLGIKLTGGSHSHITRMLTKMEIDTSHFTGQAYNKGGTSVTKLGASDVLVIDRLKGSRDNTRILRRSLLETGRGYRCAICTQGNEYFHKPLVLHIDHINGNCLDNRAKNLRFLCPNCHSQTPTYNRRKAT